MYKTIVLSLLQMHPELYEQHRRSRTLMKTLDHYSGVLKASHEAWKEHLARTNLGTGESDLASQALEIALRELEDSLVSGSPATGSEALSLDAAIAFIRGRTPPE